MIQEYVKKSSLVSVINLKENSLQEIFRFLSCCDSKFIPLFDIENESKIIGFRIFTVDAAYVKEVFLGDNVYIIKGENGNACVYNWINFRKHFEERNTNSFSDKETPQKVERIPDIIDDSGDYDLAYKAVECPRCQRKFTVKFDKDDYTYCPSCGQRLDWEVENENE